jgi:hypothetical protein
MENVGGIPLVHAGLRRKWAMPVVPMHAFTIWHIPFFPCYPQNWVLLSASSASGFPGTAHSQSAMYMLRINFEAVAKRDIYRD